MIVHPDRRLGTALCAMALTLAVTPSLPAQSAGTATPASTSATAGAAAPGSQAAGPGEPKWFAELRSSETRRDARQRPADILAALGARPGARIADIGAGRGYFTVRLAKAVGPTGRVFAVDVDNASLGRLRERLPLEGLTNVEVVQATQQETHLPSDSLDAALIVNAYHEMTDYQSTLAQIRRALKPGAQLVIVEPLDTTLREATRAKQVAAHSIASVHVVRELREAGFEIANLMDPFIQRGSIDEEWLVVARPLADRTRGSSLTQTSASPSSPAPTSATLSGAALSGAAPTSAAQANAAPTKLDAPPAATNAAAPAADTLEERFQPRYRLYMEEFAALYDRGEVLILDVRDRESYKEGHIPGAIYIPESKFEQHLEMFRAERRLIVAYCSCPAEETSGSAAVKLAKLGITNAKALVGGYRLWAAKKYPIATGDAPCNGPTCPLTSKKPAATSGTAGSSPR